MTEQGIVMDISIVVRFKPGGLCERQYLAHPEAEADELSAWVETPDDAHRFYTHADAERWAKGHPYRDEKGAVHRAWARVLGNEEPCVQRSEVPAVTKPPRASNERRAGMPHRGVATPAATPRRAMVDPAETFEALERRHLA